jgi:hypothetical protein
MAVLIEIPRLVSRMFMMFARDLFRLSLVSVPVLIDVPSFVSRMIVMLTRFVLRHGFFSCVRSPSIPPGALRSP